MNDQEEPRNLRRVLGFWALVAYGVGDILGAGIYALTGEIAAIAGRASWIAFAVALGIAGLTSLSYAELSGRFPKSGGEAKYCQEGFGSKRIAFFVGWLVLCSGVLSMATVSHAFAGYILASSEIHSEVIRRVLAAGFLVVIGFEDMANVAEEVKNPRRTLPIAILTVVGITGVIYLLVIWVATHVVTPDVLANSDAPLLEVVRHAAPSVPPILFTTIALFAVGNTGLLNSVTTSRLLYGMAGQQLLPGWVGKIHPKTRTPNRAIVIILFAAAALALTGTLGFLGGATSALILLVFLAVNLALVGVRLRSGGHRAEGGFSVPLVFPIVAATCCLALVGFVSFESMLRAGALAGIGVVFVLLRLRRGGR
ncbi:MAG: amino acid transporter [Verrucomicrobiales bacterium]|jgi:amino acid transporter